ncbi:MAG: sulfotransferase [Gammaproteobacteria bacterium]|nr:sulfotransferase [Gammaproteobacteria bacterium]
MSDVPGTVRIPFPIRAYNALLNPLERPRITVDSVEQYAIAKVGGGGLTANARRGLEALCGDAENSADLSALGRYRMQVVMRDIAVNRLSVDKALADNPALLDAPIERPMFILGLPRSGTTILFNVLAQDLAHRSPRTWEVDYPVPAPREEDYADSARIQKSQKVIDAFHRLAPSFNGIHPQGARLAEEDQRVLAMNFSGCGFQHFVRAPAHQKWQFEHDGTESFRWHKRYLQFLETNVRRPRWLLKSPDDQLYLKAILDVYPDAMIIHTHRHPAEAIPSVGSLTYTVRRLFAKHCDPEDVGVDQMNFWGDILNRCVSDRDELGMDDHLVDVAFADLVKDPMQIVRRIYDRFSLQLDANTVTRMQQFLEENKRHTHGVHKYTLEQFGLNEAMIEERFGHYIERFITA